MAELTLQYTFTDRGGAKVYDVISKHTDSDETEIDFCLGQVRIPEDPRIRELEEAIREATGACPEWDTLEPCLSDWCLVLRTALLDKHGPL